MKSILCTLLVLLSASAFAQLKFGVNASSIYDNQLSRSSGEKSFFRQSFGGELVAGYTPKDYLNVDFSIGHYWRGKDYGYKQTSIVGVSGKFIPLQTRIRPYIGAGINAMLTKYRYEPIVQTDLIAQDQLEDTHAVPVFEPSLGVMLAPSKSEKLFVNVESGYLLSIGNSTRLVRLFRFDIGLAYYL